MECIRVRDGSATSPRVINIFNINNTHPTINSFVTHAAALTRRAPGSSQVISGIPTNSRTGGSNALPESVALQDHVLMWQNIGRKIRTLYFSLQYYNFRIRNTQGKTGKVAAATRSCRWMKVKLLAGLIGASRVQRAGPKAMTISDAKFQMKLEPWQLFTHKLCDNYSRHERTTAWRRNWE